MGLTNYIIANKKIPKKIAYSCEGVSIMKIYITSCHSFKKFKKNET